MTPSNHTIRIHHSELGFFACRDTGRHICSGFQSSISEYLTHAGEWDLITEYFETREDVEFALKYGGLVHA